MEQREALTHLRSLVVRGDHAELVTALRTESWPVDSLQLIGDGLLTAVRDAADGSADLALQCANALRARRWDGDQELVEALEAALGDGPTPMLRPLPVDLEELALILEGDPVYGGGRIDLRTGEVWPQSAIEYAEEVGEIDKDDDDPDRWLWVECEGSHEGYRDMVWFIEDLDDTDIADKLSRAISGRGAFRRFKDRLSERPELMTRWHSFSNDRHR
ncbi:MAG TPA: UPF0158 family protein, partial [Kribbellaceae bacterium]|nr:UPF0158 family protein [Kribbellaceae bacterium]